MPKLKYAGPLYELLIRACPPAGPNGSRSISLLAAKLGMSDWGVRKWIRDGTLPGRRAKQIVDLGNTQVSLADFDPYVYKS